jgi:hypothetical protein
MTPRVTAVIPNWNGGNRLRRVLDDLAAQTHPVARVVIVDNASTDGSEQQPDADVISLPTNTGFAHAVNAGIAATTTEYVAILNNDVELPPEWLSVLLASLPAGNWFATGKILSARNHGVIDATFDAIARSRCPWRCGSGKPVSSVWDQPRVIHAAPLTAALYRTELFRKTGPLDERFESYLEDVDLGIRCGLAGLQGLYVPQAICYHWGSATLGVWHPETVRLLARNQRYLAAKYPPGTWLSRTGWKILAGQLLWGMVATRYSCLLPWLQGRFQGNLPGEQVTASVDFDKLEQLLFEDEKCIKELQKSQGFDLYWRLYFALT